MIASIKNKIAILTSTGLVCGFICLSNAVSPHSNHAEPELCLHEMAPTLNKNGRIDNLDEFFKALVFVESSGRADAVGDRDLDSVSVGCIQIRPIMVREVNRIIKKSGKPLRYRLKDRFDCEKSKAMFMTWYLAYHRESSFETIARNWNGGPRGYKKPSTEGYWAKMQSYAKTNL